MLISLLRIVVPYIWGIIIGGILSVVPVLEPLREQLLAYSELAVPVIALILTGAWYTLWRWLEPMIPDWLTRVLLGSVKCSANDSFAITVSEDLALSEHRDQLLEIKNDVVEAKHSIADRK